MSIEVFFCLLKVQTKLIILMLQSKRSILHKIQIKLQGPYWKHKKGPLKLCKNIQTYFDFVTSLNVDNSVSLSRKFTMEEH
jgi:hypothetical protein